MLVKASTLFKQADFRGEIDKSRKVRKGKNHLKFPIFLDTNIVTDEHKLLPSKLVKCKADEDYQTDEEMLISTITRCKKDC